MTQTKEQFQLKKYMRFAAITDSMAVWTFLFLLLSIMLESTTALICFYVTLFGAIISFYTKAYYATKIGFEE